MRSVHYPILALFFTAVLLPASGTLSAQVTADSCIGGTLYYIAYPDTVTNLQDSRFTTDYPEVFLLYIYSNVDQQITVGRVTGSPITLDLQAGEVLEFDTKDPAVPIITTANEPQSDVLKVESESPVVLYAYAATRFGSMAFTPLPVESWGREYYAATWPGETVRDIYPYVGGIENPVYLAPAPAQILIIAAYDGTDVLLEPTGELAAGTAPVQVRLNAGEAYLVPSLVDTAMDVHTDIAGTFIRAGRPVGVVTGNTRLGHESQEQKLAGNSYKEPAVEWMAPAGRHGREFVFMPTWDDFHQMTTDEPAPIFRDREYVRVYGTTDAATGITYSESDENRDIPAMTTPVNKGEFSHEVITDLQRARGYRTSGPAQAYQSPRPVSWFSKTVGDGNYVGAEFSTRGTYMVEMVPREHWGSFAPFRTPAYPAEMKHYVNVVTDSNNRGSVFYHLDGGEPQSFLFDRGRVPGTDLVWGTLKLEPGVTCVIAGEGGIRFGGFVYGSAAGYELYLPKEQGPTDYDENTAMMYGFPLPSSRCPLSVSGVGEKEKGIGGGYEITSVRPNPTGGDMEIRFRIGEAGRVRMEIMDALGRSVAVPVERQLPEGEHQIKWEAVDIPVGIWYLRVTSGEWTALRRIVVMR